MTNKTLINYNIRIFEFENYFNLNVFRDYSIIAVIYFFLANEIFIYENSFERLICNENYSQ